jgi:competence protein ComEC
MRNISLIPIALATTLGASSLWLFKTLPIIPFAFYYAILAFILCLSCKKNFALLSLIFAFSAGFLWCDEQSQQIIQNRLPSALEGVPLVVTGRIIGIPEGGAQNLHFDFLVNKIKAPISPPHPQSLSPLGRGKPPFSPAGRRAGDEGAKLPPSPAKVANEDAGANPSLSAARKGIEGEGANIPQLPQKIRLSIFSRKENNQANFHVGETWQFTVKLKQPRSTFNTASFDYEGWLFSHRFTAVGYVIDKAPKQKLAESLQHAPMSQWREHIETQLESSLANNSNLGLIEALAIGVRDQLTPTQWQVMQSTGTNHLVAIAGLHIGFVVAFMYYMVNFFWRRLPSLMLYLPAKEAAVIFSLPAAFYYSALAGFALPTQRALVMLTVGLLATLLRRNLPAWHAMAAALIAVILYDPLSVFSESFWLSFVAVGVILYCMTSRLTGGNHWQQSLRIQWIIAIGLAPITLYFFHQMSLVNLMANGIAIPWVAFIGLPLILLGVLIAPILPTSASMLWWLAAKALTCYWPVLSFLASLDRLQWHAYVPNIFFLILAMLGILIFLAPKAWPYRFLGLFGFLPLVYPNAEVIPPNSFKMTQLDVGQGLSTLIQTAHHAMIFDTGPRLDDNYDMGKNVVVPALEAKNIHSLDLLVISHGDNDHSGGAMAVLQALPVNTLLTSATNLYTALPTTLPSHLFTLPNYFYFLQQHWSKPQVINCESGQHWTWDGVSFAVISPDHDYYPRKTNDRCCVIHVTNGVHSLLLTGDIEKRTENKILQEFPQTLPSDVIIAPHHGSKTSSSEAFIQTVHPAWVVYATGYRNRFHFPNNEVIERYQALQTQSIDTALDGETSMLFSNKPDSLQAIRARVINKHFWNF